MFVNPFLFRIIGQEDSIIISLLGGGIQTIPSEISHLLFSNPEKLPLSLKKYFQKSEILFDTSEDFYLIFNDIGRYFDVQALLGCTNVFNGFQHGFSLMESKSLCQTCEYCQKGHAVGSAAPRFTGEASP